MAVKTDMATHSMARDNLVRGIIDNLVKFLEAHPCFEIGMHKPEDGTVFPVECFIIPKIEVDSLKEILKIELKK